MLYITISTTTTETYDPTAVLRNCFRVYCCTESKLMQGAGAVRLYCLLSIAVGRANSWSHRENRFV